MAPDGQEQPQRLPARRRTTKPADVTRISQGGHLGQLGPDACEGGAHASGRVPPSNSGPGGGAIPTVPGLLGGGARGTVREDLGSCPWRGSTEGPGPGVGALVRPDGAAGQPRSGAATTTKWTSKLRIRGTPTTRSTVTTSTRPHHGAVPSGARARRPVRRPGRDRTGRRRSQQGRRLRGLRPRR